MLLSIDRVGMASGRDRPYFSGKHKRHGVNVQVLADPAGRLIWASPALPGARHVTGAAREHGLIDALHTAVVQVIATATAEAGSACPSDAAELIPRRANDTGSHWRSGRSTPPTRHNADQVNAETPQLKS